MNRKQLPIILACIACAITCIVTAINDVPLLKRMIALFIVLVLFYCLGSIWKYLLDTFDKENEDSKMEMGEVIKKEQNEEDGLPDLTGESLDSMKRRRPYLNPGFNPQREDDEEDEEDEEDSEDDDYASDEYSEDESDLSEEQENALYGDSSNYASEDEDEF